ncbi:MAG TPA: efflux RND transporter periplasmic adaptor subunit, partial [Chitinophagaceae bacterium]|nr:efflux RND transporter periplasmic adaptor subunit [Chitinophagaceae bacterium]
SVWVKQGNNIVQKNIKTGLDDNTQVQVLEGLSANDEVLTGTSGVQQLSAKGAAAQSSPFMPQRPGGNRKSTR